MLLVFVPCVLFVPCIFFVPGVLAGIVHYFRKLLTSV
jgi:hypothetical protein